MIVSKARIRQLRTMAHGLNPVLRLGEKGLTENVLAELELVLEQHELIKVSIANGDKDQRKALTAALCQHSGATLVQIIGKISILYRPAQQPKMILL